VNKMPEEKKTMVRFELSLRITGKTISKTDLDVGEMPISLADVWQKKLADLGKEMLELVAAHKAAKAAPSGSGPVS